MGTAMPQIVDTMAVVERHQHSAPVDLIAIAHDLDIPVVQESLGSDVSGMLVRDPVRGGRSGFAIYLNSFHHPNRRRFTLAHELAHFILHRDLIESGITDNALYRSGLPDQHEYQANRLAAEILMPTALAQRYWQTNKNVRSLAEIFGVSEAAMKIRLDSLNLEQPSFL